MSVANTQNIVVLEPASQALAEATAGPPFLYELSPAKARAVLDELQAAPIDKLPVTDRWITVPAEVGDVRVRIVRPADAVGTLPVVLYMHGGGWVLATPTRTTDSSANSLWARAPPSSSSNTTARPKRAIPSRSSRGTELPSGSCERAPPNSS